MAVLLGLFLLRLPGVWRNRIRCTASVDHPGTSTIVWHCASKESLYAEAITWWVWGMRLPVPRSDDHFLAATHGLAYARQLSVHFATADQAFDETAGFTVATTCTACTTKF